MFSTRLTILLQYKIVNHDKVALRWSKVDGAEKYYIYQYNNKTAKYIKKGETKKTFELYGCNRKSDVI